MLRKTEDDLKQKTKEVETLKDEFCAQQTQIEELLSLKD